MSNIVLSQAHKLAQSFGIEGDAQEIVSVLKATAFKGDVTDAQLSALLIVASQYGLNPWTKEIYAFPDKNNGIVPVVGVDGWARIINENPQFDGIEFTASEKMVRMPGAKSDAPEWIEVAIYRKDRSRPTVVREYLDEVYREPFKGKYGEVIGPWQTHPKRFLRHKATIQGARLAFGFGGIFDQDEAERIVEAKSAEPKFMGNVEVVLPAWPDDAFRKRLPNWQAALASGKSHDDIIAFARTKGTLSAEQEAEIRALQPASAEAGTPPTTEQAPEQETASTTAATYEQVASRMRAAKDMDALNVAADLISAIPDESQRNELSALYDAISNEFA